MRHSPNILSASTSLIGIGFVVIGGLKLTRQNSRSYSDEIAWIAVAFLCVSLIVAYLAVRNEYRHPWQERVADGTFLLGVTSLIASVAVAAIQL